MRLRSQ